MGQIIVFPKECFNDYFISSRFRYFLFFYLWCASVYELPNYHYQCSYKETIEKYSAYITLYFKTSGEIQDFLESDTNILNFRPNTELSQLDFINKNWAQNLPFLRKLIDLLKAIFFVDKQFKFLVNNYFLSDGRYAWHVSLPLFFSSYPIYCGYAFERYFTFLWITFSYCDFVNKYFLIFCKQIAIYQILRIFFLFG